MYNQPHVPQNLYEQQRIAKEMQKYNNRIIAKMHGLHQVPKVTQKMVEEALAVNLSSIYNVPYTVFTFAKVSNEDNQQYWKHACAPTGVTNLPVYNMQLYTTPIYFTCCPQCAKITYTYERQEDTYI